MKSPPAITSEAETGLGTGKEGDGWADESFY